MDIDKNKDVKHRQLKDSGEQTFEVYLNENQRLTLKNEGLQRISSFSWEHTTNKVKEALFLSLNLTK